MMHRQFHPQRPAGGIVSRRVVADHDVGCGYAPRYHGSRPT
jgi:hypothetical protein